MSYTLNKNIIPPNVRTLLEELQEVLRKHKGEIDGNFSIYTGGKRLHNVMMVAPDQVDCWGREYDPRQEDRED